MLKRQDHEQPAAIAKLGWRYHHLGVPTDTPRPHEKYITPYKMHVSGFDSSQFGVEWMRFEPGSPIADIIQTVPHIAFEVDDLDEAIKGRELIGEVTTPSDGVRVAMFIENGAPIELIEFKRSEK
ncbi:hypothetical protein JW960_25085 [candidate division KSB1 bacterium]|nr:hypothetical protein [candidate division KSB1 bacterium]